MEWDIQHQLPSWQITMRVKDILIKVIEQRVYHLLILVCTFDNRFFRISRQSLHVFLGYCIYPQKNYEALEAIH